MLLNREIRVSVFFDTTQKYCVRVGIFFAQKKHLCFLSERLVYYDVDSGSSTKRLLFWLSF
jgi:hypothetical protein